MAQVADHVCHPDHAERFGDYRTHVLGVFLDSDNQLLASELEKLDPDHLVDIAVATAQSVSRREGLRDDLARAVQRALADNNGRTVRDWLREAGVGALSEEEWRQGMQERLTSEARVFIETPAFIDWLDDLLA